MKYMLLIYDSPKTIDKLTKSGELLGGEALAHPTTTKTVCVVNGAPELQAFMDPAGMQM